MSDSLIDFSLSALQDHVFEDLNVGESFKSYLNFLTLDVILLRVLEILLKVVPVVNLLALQLLKFFQNLLVLLI